MSQSSSACNLDLQYQGFIDASFQLTDANIRRMMGVNNGYIYAIDNLRPEWDIVSTPCTLGEKHRWRLLSDVTSPGDCAPPNYVHPDTVATLVSYIEDALPTFFGHVVDVDLTLVTAHSGTCVASNTNTLGMKAWVGSTNQCFQHTHPDNLNVYDFTAWANNHPGGSTAISKWIESYDTTVMLYADGTGGTLFHVSPVYCLFGLSFLIYLH